LGEARDWDVFVGETLAGAAPSAPLPAGLAALRRRALAARRRARLEAADAMVAPDYTASLIRLTAALHALAGDRTGRPQAESLKRVAGSLLSNQHGRVIKRGRKLDQLTFRDLHRLRIEVKRL